jgi:hypothetical protein
MNRAGKEKRVGPIVAYLLQVMSFAFALLSILGPYWGTIRTTVSVLVTGLISFIIITIYAIFVNIIYRYRFRDRAPNAILYYHYTFSKVVVYVATALLIIFLAISFAKLDSLLIGFFEPWLGNTFVIRMELGLSVLISAEIYNLVPIVIIKDFRFYYGKKWVKDSLEIKDEVKRTRSFITGLNWYTRYLRQNLNFQINEVQVYPRIISLGTIERNQLIEAVCKAFEDFDKLKPINCLSTHMQIPQTEQILVPIRLLAKITQLSGLMIPIFTVIISIINFFVKSGK